MMQSFFRSSVSAKKPVPSDFKGIFASVFTSFQSDENQTLQLSYIEEYAVWLKERHIKGVLVNSTTGEGPVLGLIERKLNAEAWSRACKKCSLLMMLQIGGAPLPDVLDLARHANDLHIHAVVCIGELFYVPTKMEQLVGYCKIVAEKCANHFFLYYHLPELTKVKFNPEEFFSSAEMVIPTFAGLVCTQTELMTAIKCLSEDRIILMGDSKMLASGMLMGFDAAIMTVANMEPILMKEIYDAMLRKDLKTAKTKQHYLNQLIRNHVTKGKSSWISDMKKWFNERMRSSDGCGIYVGTPRKFGVYEL
ncbi:N-acetylneuraminate lyase B-like [Bactrocera tryoni]|uniref:N-acetylneuraminate lyase B-like n=1 Tax=Bactrocera tryoni TaxID=59916 RepID=UPI001A970E1F|nr:N-acetylneuraminate lyase B-like [Bactrocera tryoni]